MGVSLGDLLALAQADVSVAFSDSSQISSTLSDLVLGVSKMSLLADLILFSKQVGRFLCLSYPYSCYDFGLRTLILFFSDSYFRGNCSCHVCSGISIIADKYAQSEHKKSQVSSIETYVEMI